MAISGNLPLGSEINTPVSLATMPAPRKTTDTTERINALLKG